MSVDREVTENLMEVLQDGAEGFSHAADKLQESDRSDLAPKFRAYSEQRTTFYRELETLAARYGENIDESGSMKAAAHRAWLSVKDSLSGSDPDGVLDAAEQGEDHTIESYQDALSKEISVEVRRVVQRQFDDVQRAHDEVRALRDAARA